MSDTALTAPTPDAARDLARVERIATLLDSRFTIPGTRIRFGLDSVVGLIPGVGDTAMLIPSLWIMAVAHKHGVRKRTIAKMGWYAGIDYVVGSVPVLGDLFDLFYKSHRKNAALLREALTAPAGPDVYKS